MSRPDYSAVTVSMNMNDYHKLKQAGYETQAKLSVETAHLQEEMNRLQEIVECQNKRLVAIRRMRHSALKQVTTGDEKIHHLTSKLSVTEQKLGIMASQLTAYEYQAEVDANTFKRMMKEREELVDRSDTMEASLKEQLGEARGPTWTEASLRERLEASQRALEFATSELRERSTPPKQDRLVYCSCGAKHKIVVAFSKA